MPATSARQRQFFGLVRAIQQGRTKGSARARKVAGSISAKDAADFARQPSPRTFGEVVRRSREPR